MPDLSELIEAVKSARGFSFADLAARSDHVITRGRWGQLGKGARIIEFPEPATMAAIAKALDVDVNRVVLSVAVSVGLPIKPDGSDLAAMLPQSARDLTPEQRDAILAVVKAMNPYPIAPPADRTQHAGISGTAPPPDVAQDELDLAANKGDASAGDVQRQRDEQDEFHPDPEGPEDGA